MFSTLGNKVQAVFEKISGRGKLSIADVDVASRDIKLALLSADVNYHVVREFVESVSKTAVGLKIHESLNPAQVFTKVVHDQLIETLGGVQTNFDFTATPPLVIVLVGLQGSGKTTTAAKFAQHCKKSGRTPYLVPADVKRPAAIEQLKSLAKKNAFPCYDTQNGDKAPKVVKRALKEAKSFGYDTVIIDTAGRLHIDEEMMQELKEVIKVAEPQRILYVADAMTGQDALLAAKSFNESIPITGLVFTKMDGDARGGAVLSVKHITGKPILFAGIGESIKDFEVFDPKRVAGRILNMGDIVGLVEKVQEGVDEADMKRAELSFRNGELTLDDFMKQLDMVRKLGGLGGIMKMIPGMGNLGNSGVDPKDAEAELKWKRAILSSMTPKERRHPKILNGSRRLRIAKGSGTDQSAVNRLLKDYEMMSQMMKKLSKGGMGGLKNLMRGLTLK
ncbi:MAG: signal recognition particle protein [Pseudomonadota bacterium]